MLELAETLSEPVADVDLTTLLSEARSGSSRRVEDGLTLPPRAYMSQAFYDLEVEKIFKREWICVGHVSQVANVGDYFTLELFGEPIVVVRGADKVRALSSVCLHRWAPVAEGKGNTKVLSCPFHKWGYALDGTLLGAPFMDKAAGFVPRDCKLPEFRSEIVDDLGLIFITFSTTASSIGASLESLCERARQENWDFPNNVIVDVVEQDNNYNWKIQVETYMECYHHIGAHSKTIEPDSPGGRSWCEEDHGSWTACHGGEKPGATPEELASDPPGYLILAYPLLMFGVSRKWRGFRLLFPVGPNRTKSIIYTLRPADHVAAADFPEELEKYITRNNAINEEDNAVNDMQQIGAASNVARSGRFSHLEASSWHLAEYVRRRISGN